MIENNLTTVEFIGPFSHQLYSKLDYALESILLEGTEPKTALQSARDETMQQLGEAQKTFVR